MSFFACNSISNGRGEAKNEVANKGIIGVISLLSELHILSSWSGSSSAHSVCCSNGRIDEIKYESLCYPLQLLRPEEGLHGACPGGVVSTIEDGDKLHKGRGHGDRI